MLRHRKYTRAYSDTRTYSLRYTRLTHARVLRRRNIRGLTTDVNLTPTDLGRHPLSKGAALIDTVGCPSPLGGFSSSDFRVLDSLGYYGKIGGAVSKRKDSSTKRFIFRHAHRSSNVILEKLRHSGAQRPMFEAHQPRRCARKCLIVKCAA